MFKNYHAFVLASSLALSAFAIPTGTASAASLPYVHQNTGAGDNGLRHEVKRKSSDNQWWENNNNRRRGDNDRRRGNHHRHDRHRNFDNFGIYVSPLILGGGYGYNDGYRHSGNAHEEWCFDHYPNSYNPNDNTWVSYSGDVRVCRSPYGY